MASPVSSVLFLCTGNSARSIMAESLLNHLGKGRFRAFSAGSYPKGTVHPYALDTLRGWGFSIEGLRSKGWHELAGPDAPRIDLVITVCDNAARETCPVWPGSPMTAHWGVEDPAAFEGPEDEKRELFRRVGSALRDRIEQFLDIPFTSLDANALRARLEEIGAG